jgi:hypothetical protein
MCIGKLLSIYYGKSSSTGVSIYIEVDWAGCIDDRRSIVVMLFLLDLILSHGVPRESLLS